MNTYEFCFDLMIMFLSYQVYKTGVTHYFSVEKARKDLGYNPTVQNDLSGVVKHYRAAGHMHSTGGVKTAVYYLVNVLLGLFIASMIMSFLPYAK